MIEDVELTRKVLEFFAKEDVPFPANVTIDNLSDHFPNEDPGRLNYHVMCAAENELLIVPEMNRVSTLKSATYVIGRIDGLTVKGGDYVKHSRTKFWQQAKEKCASLGLKQTTDILCNLVFKLVHGALGDP